MNIITTGPLHGRKIEHALRELCGIKADAFALAVIDDAGLITTYLSKGLHTQHELLFPSAFYDEFRRSQNCHSQPYKQGLLITYAPLIFQLY
jgi:hypothetical protein